MDPSTPGVLREPTAEARPGQGAAVRLQILGPLRIWRGAVELSPGPRQQAYLLALLLAREGHPIGGDELVDLMWGEDAPASALNVIQQYVGALRRLLEPALASRKSGSYLLRRGNGYQCVAGPGVFDLADFRALVGASRVELEEERHGSALDLLVDALSLWHGPAAAGMDHGPAATAVFTALDDEFLSAAVTAADLGVATGRAGVVLPPLRLAARMAPFDEAVHASLITALGAAGHQAEALDHFHVIRTRLVDELGIQPGHALHVAQRRVLTQDVTPAVDLIPPVSPRPTAPSAALFGRDDELESLRSALTAARDGGTGVVLLEGESGVGKTHLLETVTAEAAARGALVVWSQCVDGDGAPSMWPWVQVVDAVLRRQPPATKDDWLAGDLGLLVTPSSDRSSDDHGLDGTSQFALFERVIALLEDVSARRPLVLVLDDLQWADAASLRLLVHVVERRVPGVVTFGALRDRAPAPGTELGKALAAIGKMAGHRRITLRPLSIDEVAELIGREIGRPPTEAVTRSVFERTDGNPLFVRELSRLLSSTGALDDAAVGHGVPSTIRDVVQNLSSGLDDDARELLQLAALIGRDVDLGLLARAAELDVHTCLGRLEPVEALGLLGPAPGDPFALRFGHDVVREAFSSNISPHRALQSHLRIADALQDDESPEDSGVERLAHHLWQAGPLADPTRAVRALVRAGRRAAARTALETAERQLRAAVQVARTANLAEVELAALSELVTVVGMSSPHGTAAMAHLERAEYLAKSLGREEEAAVLLYSRWMALAYSAQYGRGEALARRLLEQGDASSIAVVRALGQQAWGLQQASVGNIGDAFRCLTEASRGFPIVPTQRENDVVWLTQQLSALGLLAEMTAVHGDLAGARLLLDELESLAGDDPFKITVWAVHSVRIASVAGDHDWTLAVTTKGIAADPELSFGFFGMYQRLARFWALAMAGRDPNGSAAEVERLITENLLDPPRSDIATWYGLLGEMYLAAGALNEAAGALDRADEALDAYGQRYGEGLILLIRARLLHARAGPAAEVAAAAEAARELSIAREAHLFARRAESFLAEVCGDQEASACSAPRRNASPKLQIATPMSTRSFSKN